MPTATLGDVDLWYEINGDTGPWLIFAHGGGDNHLTWWRQVAALQGRYRCLAYDARGHGQSSDGTVVREADQVASDDLVRLMDHLAIDRAFVNGHSMGGLAAAGLAQARPERVRGIVMSCTAFGFRTAAMSRWAGQMVEKAGAGYNVLDHIFAQDYATREPELHFLHRAIARLNRPRIIPRNSKAYLAAYERIRDAPPADYRAFAVPALFVLGERDELQVPWLIEETARAVGGAELVRIPGSGHNVHVEQPGPYLAAVTAFLEKHA